MRARAVDHGFVEIVCFCFALPFGGWGNVHCGATSQRLGLLAFLFWKVWFHVVGSLWREICVFIFTRELGGNGGARWWRVREIARMVCFWRWVKRVTRQSTSPKHQRNRWVLG
ncbi:hypothetical protein B0J12DRAFT_683831 [Macrophomina phaseolina]|uniref:Transmembrane protein n=1 Tax=Macrophomina phaseolina TaxID=35725 RepID=A0ABQ8FXM1_9PEZI|nr:hypothetical protein B0J12DRAFT_683831 [Macrophomina phaseolina]